MAWLRFLISIGIEEVHHEKVRRNELSRCRTFYSAVSRWHSRDFRYVDRRPDDHFAAACDGAGGSSAVSRTSTECNASRSSACLGSKELTSIRSGGSKRSARGARGRDRHG